MAYILLVNAENSLYFEITVCSVKLKNGNLHYSFNVKNVYPFFVKYTNVSFKIQIFLFRFKKTINFREISE